MKNPSNLAGQAEAALIESLYLKQPSMEFRIALDQAAASLEEVQQPTLAVISSAFYGIELLRRCRGQVHLAGECGFDVRSWLACASAWGWGRIEVADLAAPNRYSGLFWAEPEAGSAQEIAALLYQRALPRASLDVIVSTSFRQFLPAWQNAPRPSQDPLPVGRLLRLLNASGWHIEQVSGFHGPRTLVWANLVRLFQSIGRLDWADRAGFALRASYIEQGWLCKITPLMRIYSRIP